NKLDEIGMLAPIMFPMAHCLVKLKRFQEACQLAADAIKIRRRIDDSLDTGDSLREYATTLVAAGRLKDAIEILDEAEEQFNRGGFMHYATATRLQKAELLLKTGSLTEAYELAQYLKQYFEEQGLVARSTDAILIMVDVRVVQLQWELQSSEEQRSALLEEAHLLCLQVAVLAEQHRLREQAYKSEYFMGRLAALRGSTSDAERHYGSAIKRVERILDNLAYDQRPAFLQSTWTIYEDMIALCLREQQTERAFRYLEQARSLALRQYLGRGGKVQGNEDAKALQAQNAVLLRVQNELSEWQGRYRTYSALQAQSAALLRVQNELSEWQGRYRGYSDLLEGLDTGVSGDVKREVIQEELRQCETKINELFERLHLLQVVDDVTQAEPTLDDETAESQGIDVGALREQLAPGQLLLAYFLYKGRLVIFALTREHFVTYENSEGLAQLERLLPPLYAHLEPRGWPDPQQPPRQAVRRLLRKLYDLLIEPVKALLPAEEGLLTIVPYGPLHSLPFHALYSGERFLIEDFQVHYLPASSVLLHLSEAQRAVAGKSPLIFGHSGHGYLPRALAEAQSVAELVKGRCYQEGEATIERLMEEAGGSALIHLATHGHCRLDAPNFSFVQLADGQLNAIDAFGLNLEGCELVTLSGCETGLALIGGGDEQLGLGRAFLAAGASALVMSLWPVEDSSTNELMQLFYERLLHGDSKVEALRAAQRHLLLHADALYTHPYFWAAFRLVGDVGPLSGVR
ncbi:MAG: CHAT domain-containing protein, partial [Ktedonobacteraceae bacterium]|nr:CHAT domain-containing protein [Ktedonobacteraceae bacterium]